MPAVIRVPARGASAPSAGRSSNPSSKPEQPFTPQPRPAQATPPRQQQQQQQRQQGQQHAKPQARQQSSPPERASGIQSRRLAGRPKDKQPPRTLFAKEFKSIGPRSYSAEVMQAGNGNHYIVLNEAKPDRDTGEMRKTRLFIFSEDFDEFWNLMRDVAKFVRDNPLPDDVRKKREKFWANAAEPIVSGSAK